MGYYLAESLLKQAFQTLTAQFQIFRNEDSGKATRKLGHHLEPMVFGDHGYDVGATPWVPQAHHGNVAESVVICHL